MPIDGGLRNTLAPGTLLRGKHKGTVHTAEVIAGQDGKPRFRLADGREFASPSAAGKAVTGTACNGWRFWSLAGGEKAPSAPTVGPTPPPPDAGATTPAPPKAPDSAATAATSPRPAEAAKPPGPAPAARGKARKPAGRAKAKPPVKAKPVAKR